MKSEFEQTTKDVAFSSRAGRYSLIAETNIIFPPLRRYRHRYCEVRAQSKPPECASWNRAVTAWGQAFSLRSCKGRALMFTSSEYVRPFLVCECACFFGVCPVCVCSHPLFMSSSFLAIAMPVGSANEYCSVFVLAAINPPLSISTRLRAQRARTSWTRQVLALGFAQRQHHDILAAAADVSPATAAAHQPFAHRTRHACGVASREQSFLPFLSGRAGARPHEQRRSANRSLGSVSG